MMVAYLARSPWQQETAWHNTKHSVHSEFKLKYMFHTWELCGGKIHPKRLLEKYIHEPHVRGSICFHAYRGFWEESGRVNREDCRGTSSGEDVCPRYHHPCTFSLVSDTEQEERTQKSTGWKKWQNPPLVFNTFQAKAFLWIPSMINWIWDWSLNWTGLCIFKYQNRQTTKVPAGDIFEEGKGNWNRECLKGMVGTEMFFSCSLNWCHEGIMEIFTGSGYTSQHNWCYSFGSWKHPLCNHDKLWVSSLLCASDHLPRKWTGFTK